MIAGRVSVTCIGEFSRPRVVRDLHAGRKRLTCGSRLLDRELRQVRSWDDNHAGWRHATAGHRRTTCICKFS